MTIFTHKLTSKELKENKVCDLSFMTFLSTRSCAALRAADLGLSGQDAFRARTFGRFLVSLFSPLELSSNWILILIPIITTLDGGGGAGQE